MENNYYNFVNCYGKFFHQDNQFIPNATFKELQNVHHFDKEIKTIFFQYIIEAEKHFAAIVSYVFSKNHSEKYSYLISSNFDPDKILKISNTISDMSKVINYNSKQSPHNNPIKHYIAKYPHVPLWVLSNHLNFGQIFRFFESMNASEKNEIAKEFSIFLNNNTQEKITLSSAELSSFLKNLIELRNIVAHNNKILGFKCRENTKFINQLHSKYGIESNSERQNIYNVFISLQCFLTKNQYARLHNSILKRSKFLSGQLISIDSNLILSSLGFPNNWHKITQKRAQETGRLF